MPYADLQALCSDYCLREGIPEPELPRREGVTKFDMCREGVDIVWAHSARTAPDRAIAIVELGPFPPGPVHELCSALLAVNYVIDAGLPVTFACRPGDGQAVLMASVPLQELDRERLYELLDTWVPRAREWRQSVGALDPGVNA